MLTLERYLRHERAYVALLAAALLFINNTINATSILMEADRDGADIPLLQPFITEYSSALATLLLIPFIVAFNRHFPIQWQYFKRRLLAHALFSVAFSLAHISLFVLMRKLMFGLHDLSYVYSNNLLVSFVYEYRKDAWLYVTILIGIYSYGFIMRRLRGEAVPVAGAEDSPAEAAPERFLVRKLGKEFVVRVDDVEWLEAAGNYVNLHLGNRVYPLRATMSRLLDDLAGQGFVRIHRSRGVNLDFVESLAPLESGDCTVNLKSGVTVQLSRRYRDDFRARLYQRTGG